MGLFEMFAKDCACPECRTRGAKRWGSKVKCRNPNCVNYDRTLAERLSARMESKPTPPLPTSGDFDPGSNTIEIRYRNFRGDEQTYRGDRRTLRFRGDRISLCLAPTGRRASFATKWIISPSGLQEEARKAKDERPSGVERRVLAYHKKRKSTSPLYERLRAKYPNF